MAKRTPAKGKPAGAPGVLGRLGIGTILTLVGAVGTWVAVVMVWPPSKSMRLLYLSKLSILAPGADLSADLRVTFGGQPVKQPYKIRGRVVNDGGLKIRPSDIEQPLRLDFGASRLLQCDIVGRDPSTLKATQKIVGNAIVFELGLLNSGDSFEFEAFCDGNPGWPRPAARIEDLKTIRMTIAVPDTKRVMTRASRTFRASVLLGFAGLCACLLGTVIFFFIDSGRRPERYGPYPVMKRILYGIAIVGYLGLVVVTLWESVSLFRDQSLD